MSWIGEMQEAARDVVDLATEGQRKGWVPLMRLAALIEAIPRKRPRALDPLSASIGAMLMREVICEQLYRRRAHLRVIDLDHVNRIVGTRLIGPADIERFVDPMRQGALDAAGWREEAARVLDALIAERPELAS